MPISNNQPTQQEIEARKKVLMDAWTKSIAEDAAKFGPGYTKKEFTFTRSEHLQLTKQQTIQALAADTAQDILNTLSLPRVGVNPSSDIKITYDLTIGRFVVFEPKASSSKVKTS